MPGNAPPHIHDLANAAGGWLRPAEGDLLFHLAGQCRAGCIVEIGSFEGKSITYLAAGSNAAARVPVYSIDPHTGNSGGSSTFPAFQRQVARSGFAHLVRPIVATSQQAAIDFNDPIGLLFIDGAHDDASVKSDWDQWVPKVLPGGYVAMHDTLLWRAPREIAEERIIRSPEFVRAGVADSITFGMKRQSHDAPETRLRQWRVLLLKRASNAAARVPLPDFAKAFGSRALRALQR
ncbi:MAG TPA: class I SAM-dependent methyltransferase [Bryobacteraceae bacterium]